MTPQEQWFLQRRSQGKLVVLETPKFDLDSYIANYSGRTRIDRLYHIGITSLQLSEDALKTCVAEIKQGANVHMYEAVINVIRQTLPNDSASLFDANWATKMSTASEEQSKRLETELTGYKNNLIKESIRMGNEDLAKHYYEIGDLAAAAKAAARMRDYCTLPKHILEMCLKQIHINISRQDWHAVQTAVIKVRNLQLKTEDKVESEPRLAVAQGLAQLGSSFYKDAAMNFLAVDPTLGNSFNTVMTANDVAVYGGLCALASMDRTDLQKHVLGSTTFRPFLELEPHIRRAITLYCSSKYSAALEILEAYRPDYLLDIHLAPHLTKLMEMTRTKSIVQYFIPFSCVTLSSMASAFGTNKEEMEEELGEMIHRGTLNARIDLEHQTLVSLPVDLRAEVHANVLETAKAFERETRQRLLRMNLVNANLDIKGPKPRIGMTSGMGQRVGMENFSLKMRGYGYE